MKKRQTVQSRRNNTDFSHQAVIIMLLLLVVASIISIGFYIHILTNTKPAFIVNEGKSAGEVLITITKAPAESTDLGTVPQSDTSEDTNLNSQS